MITDEDIAIVGIRARDEALISGAPLVDAAWIGIEAIETVVRDRLRLELGLVPARFASEREIREMYGL